MAFISCRLCARPSRWSSPSAARRAGLERGRAGLRPRPQSALSDPPGGKPKPHRPPWPGSSTGEVTPWGFLGVFLLRGQDLATWACGAIGRGVGAGQTPPWRSSPARAGLGRGSLSPPQASVRESGPVPECERQCQPSLDSWRGRDPRRPLGAQRPHVFSASLRGV